MSALGIAFLATQPLAAEKGRSAVPSQVAEIALRLPLPIGNATFTPKGRIFVSHHPMFGIEERVSEVTSPTSLKPFPNETWNRPRAGTEAYLDSVLGLRSDSGGVVWMLDMGSRTKITPKLVAWNTRDDSLHATIPLPEPATRSTSDPNDLVIDEKNGKIFITDEGTGGDGDGSQGALIVVDLATRQARRLLEGHVSTRPENVSIMVDGREMIETGKSGSGTPMRVGADGIALDHRSEWLCWGPLNGGSVYRARVDDLLDASLAAADLRERVERYADRPNAGGLSIDAEDNLYLTEVGARAVGVIPKQDRTYRRLATHPDLLWPDGLSAAPNGLLYVTSSQLPLAPPFNGGTSRLQPPYLVFRLMPLAKGRVGH